MSSGYVTSPPARACSPGPDAGQGKGRRMSAAAADILRGWADYIWL